MWVRSLQFLIVMTWVLNSRFTQQIVILTSASLEVYDTHISKIVESTHFDTLSLVSPSLSYTTNGAIPYSESVGEVAHSVRMYKGKIFLLVGFSPFCYSLGMHGDGDINRVGKNYGLGHF